MNSEIEKLIQLRTKALANNNYWNEYVGILNKIFKDIKKNSKSDKEEDLNNVINFYDDLIKYYHNPDNKDFKKDLKSEERYTLYDILLIKIFCELKISIIEDNKILDGLIIRNEIDKARNIKKKINIIIKKLRKEIRKLKIGNRIFLYNKLIESFRHWQKVFVNDIDYKDNMRYWELWSTMKLRLYLGLSFFNFKNQ